MLYSNLIDSEAFAVEERVLEGSVKLDAFDKRVWSHEYLADCGTPVFFRLQGGKGQRPFLDIELKADLSLVCQRCMEAMPFKLDEVGRIVLFEDEESLDKAMQADDELEGMVFEKELDISVLLEDQILMALPFSPRHDDCKNRQLDAINQEKDNPFAVLSGLKNNR